MRPAAAAGTVLLFAGGLAAQAAMQGPLGHANDLRSARHYRPVPGPLLFSLGTGGVKEAAADALWLTALPTLGQPWEVPPEAGSARREKSKAQWIQEVVAAIQAASPRWSTPVIYGCYFLEFQSKTHPGIERICRRAMEAEVRGAKVNADRWEFPYVLGWHYFLMNRAYVALDGRSRVKDSLAWLSRMARIPECPPYYREAVGNMLRREAAGSGGSELDGWELHRASWREQVRKAKAAGGDPLEGWGGWMLRGYDEARLRLLRDWAGKAERRLGRWPRDGDEVLAEASSLDRERLAEAGADAGRRLADELLDGVEVHAGTREVEIPRLTALLLADGRDFLRELARRYETEHHRAPARLEDLAGRIRGPLPAPPRHGTRWDLRPGGAFETVPDPDDPRLKRP